jgi:cation transporter-like permease
MTRWVGQYSRPEFAQSDRNHSTVNVVMPANAGTQANYAAITTARLRSGQALGSGFRRNDN